MARKHWFYCGGGIWEHSGAVCPGESDEGIRFRACASFGERCRGCGDLVPGLAQTVVASVTEGCVKWDLGRLWWWLYHSRAGNWFVFRAQDCRRAWRDLGDWARSWWAWIQRDEEGC